MPDKTDPPIVLVARRLLPAGLERLRSGAEIRSADPDASAAELSALAPGCSALVSDLTLKVDAELLDAFGAGLRVVANVAVGYENIDLAACRERGVVVTNTPDVLTDATAELALALTLAAARRLGAAEADLRAGRWTGWDPGAYLGVELSGATFGVVGLGRIGRRYAELVRPLAGELLHATPTPKPETEAELGIERVELDELLRRADVVSLHAPGGEMTEQLIDGEALALMKRTAVLVNTARGSLIDEEALARALDADELGAAGLDVYSAEPDVPAALLAASRCVLLPHIGSATRTTRNAMARLAADNVLAVLAGDEPLTPV